jgi:predicted GTPase
MRPLRWNGRTYIVLLFIAGPRARPASHVSRPNLNPPGKVTDSDTAKLNLDHSRMHASDNGKITSMKLLRGATFRRARGTLRIEGYFEEAKQPQITLASRQKTGSRPIGAPAHRRLRGACLELDLPPVVLSGPELERGPKMTDRVKKLFKPYFSSD